MRYAFGRRARSATSDATGADLATTDEQFYVFFPLTALVWLVARRSGRRCGDTR